VAKLYFWTPPVESSDYSRLAFKDNGTISLSSTFFRRVYYIGNDSALFEVVGWRGHRITLLRDGNVADNVCVITGKYKGSCAIVKSSKRFRDEEAEVLSDANNMEKVLRAVATDLGIEVDKPEMLVEGFMELFWGKMVVHRWLAGIWNHDNDESYSDSDADEDEDAAPSLFQIMRGDF
jgi:hypothetical protein